MKQPNEVDLINEIRLRWHATKLVSLWTELPRERREKVTAEFEESAREMRETHQPLATDILVALDCLDAIGDAAQPSVYEQACNDVEDLIRILRKREQEEST